MRFCAPSLSLFLVLIPAAAQTRIPAYTPDGRFILPPAYREGIFLSSGLDMTYGPGPAAAPAAHSRFENVFVNPEAYRAFLATGTWPDHTVLVLEIRGAETDASINRSGKTQGAAVHGLEVHVKDVARFPSAGGWSFFDIDASTGIGKLIPPPASCYTCHADHAAVDTTFVQFYPTLLPLAKAKSTLSTAYLKELTLSGSPAPAPANIPAAH